MGAYALTLAIFLGINLLLALGLHLITGLTGQFSLGHAAFMAVGAYTSALLSLHTSLPFAVSLAAGMALAAVVGWLLAFPCNKFEGDYLALVTLGFGEIVRIVLLNLTITNGALGLYGIPAKTDIFWVWGLAGAATLIYWRIEHSRSGRAMVGIRQDPDASKAVGIDINLSKQAAFTIGVATAGLAGGLYAHYLTYLNPGDFGFMMSVQFILFVIIGGVGDFRGVFLGTVTLTVLPELLRSVSDYRVMLYGIILVLVMVYQPTGLAGLLPKRRGKATPATALPTGPAGRRLFKGR